MQCFVSLHVILCSPIQLFERRNKIASTAKFERIKKYWDEVSAEMMTEEETGDEDDYIRHRPAWRSQDFNKMVDLLDAQREGVRSLARPRQIGTPSTVSPPSTAKKWMIATEEPSESLVSFSSDDENLQQQ